MVNHIILNMDNYLEINIFPYYISLGAFGHCHVNSKVDGKSWNILTMKALLDILYVSLITNPIKKYKDVFSSACELQVF